MQSEGKRFDQQVHDAFERIELSDEAQQRMLNNLLAAQELKQAEGAKAPAEAARQHPAWHVLLPLAAALVLALVVVNVTGVGTRTNTASEPNVPASEEPQSESAEARQDGAASDAASDAAGGAKNTLGASEAYERGPAMASLYPCVTLENGTELTTLWDGSNIREIAPSQVGELVGTAQASVYGGEGNAVACEVFSLKDKGDAYAVRYEGDGTYWGAVPLE